MELEEVLQQLAESTAAVADELEGKSLDEVKRAGTSRYVGQYSTPEGAREVQEKGGYHLARPASEERGHAKAGGGFGTQVKALAEGTGSAGGVLVAPEVAEGILTALRARSAIYRMGPRTIDVKKLLSVLSMSSGATAYYTAENAAIPVSEQTFAEAALLAPKELTAMVPVSNRLLRDADDPSIETIIREDLAEVLALRADLAFLRGTGTGEPRGIVNTVGVTPGPNLGAAGGVPTFSQLKTIPASLRALNAPFRSPGWVFHPRLLASLEAIVDGEGHFLMDDGLLTFDETGGGGTLLGYKFVTTTQLPINQTVGASTDTTTVIFSSDWDECWIGEEQAFTIDLSAEASYTPDAGTTWISAFQNRQTLFRASWAHDLGLRRPQLFVVTPGVRP